MDRLRDILQETMTGYTGKALNGYSYLTANLEHNLFTVVSIGELAGERIVDTGLVARIFDDKIIVERDVNDKPLVDALTHAGIEREQVVLAYAGEVAKV